MQVLKKARRVVQNINRSSQLLESIQLGVSNQSELINRKLSELIGIMRNGETPQDNIPAATPAAPAVPSEFSERTVRPLEKIAEYPSKKGVFDLNSVVTWRASESFKNLAAYFKDYPNNSLISLTGRALLYHLVRTLRPQVAVEIGTYYAASSEVMARGMWENGMGIVHTTDPYGEARCPIIINQWPEELRQHVRFYPHNSMGLFDSLEREKTVIDIAFIDGNHDFEYAYFDVLSSAKLIRPGGIIILDNIEQCGPFWAAVEFLRTHPEWREIGDSISRFSPSRPFNETLKFLGEASFVVLQAPEQYVVTSAPKATGQSHYSHPRISGIKLDMAFPAPKGTLHAQMILRGFCTGGEPPEQLIANITIPLCGQSSMARAMLDKPLISALKAPTVITHYTQETVLFWQPDGHSEPLRLKTAPEPFA